MRNYRIVRNGLDDYQIQVDVGEGFIPYPHPQYYDYDAKEFKHLPKWGNDLSRMLSIVSNIKIMNDRNALFDTIKEVIEC